MRKIRYVMYTSNKLCAKEYYKYYVNIISGINKPTPIQQHCIIPILEGRDCVGAAKTGSGKTFAFALPILQKLSDDPYGIFALVLTPTHELAYQVHTNINIIIIEYIS